MILLDGHSLNQRGLLEPETMALNLAERDSTATVTAGLDILSVSTGDWIKDNEDPGAGIVWRVKTVETQYDTETKTLQLEHLIRSLADKIINEEVTPETIAGEGAVYCSAYAAAEYILDRQSDWVLGDFDYTEVENPYTFDGDTLLAALETVSRSLEDPIWVYDFSSYPFTLHIRRRSENVTSEMRQGRNITTLKATVDRSRMYTRFYPVGKNNLRLDDPGYVAKNENIYGIVEKTETDQSMDTAEKLYAWAQERLNRHCEPQVTITISGADLSAATGESLDSFRIGDQCRVPLPDYGTTISEKIVKLQWRDKIKDRETVTITLANTLEDVQSILQKEKAAGSRGARGGAKMAEENETLIGDVYAGLYTRISQTAYEIRLEAHNEAESMRSIISQTAESIRISVENDRESLRTLIVQTASYIRTEAHNEAESIRSFVVQTASEIRGEVVDEANSLRSLVSQTASEIRGEVVDEAGSIRSLISQTASTIRGEVADEANSLRSLVTQTASEWSARIEGVADSEGRVTAASIAASINDTGEGEIQISADKVYIGNTKSSTVIAGKCALSDVTADYIAGKIATIPSLTFLAASGATMTTSGGVYAAGLYLGNGSYTSIKDIFLEDVKLTSIGNTYTLTKTVNGVDTTIGTFSRATSLSGAWSGVSGVYTVTASPQGDTESATLDHVSQYGSTYQGITDTRLMVPCRVYDDNDVAVFEYEFGCDATPIWTAGIAEGESHFTPADIRLQGDPEDVYVPVGTGGSVYYTAGSVVSYWQGNGATVTGRGDAITRYKEGSSRTFNLRNVNSSLTLKAYNSGNEVTLYVAPTGGATGYKHKWYYVDSGGTTYYRSNGNTTVTVQGDEETVYAGNGATVTGRGDIVSVTPINNSSAKRLTYETRYKQGQRYQSTYYTKDT